MRVMSSTWMALAVVLSCSAIAHSAAAQDAAQDSVANFFKDKTITLEVGAPPGGVLDLHARLVSRHLARHIPGNPNLRVAYKPGAGSKVAARGLYTVAPKDGTWIDATFPSAIV